MKKFIVITTLLLFALSGALLAAPRIVIYPKVLKAQDEDVTLRWDDGAGGDVTSAVLLYGYSPLNYTGAIVQDEVNALTFTAQSESMAGGVYYCRVSDNADGSWSSEFKLYVEATNDPSMISPAPFASLTDTTPDFQWMGVNGVPYTSIMLFDTKANTTEANVIWAAITDQTSIEYPGPDPSGYFDQIDPPPLVQGLTYTWGIFNNYSGAPTMFPSNLVSIRSFIITTPAGCAAPNLVSPADGVTYTASDTITLDWDAATGANNYKVVLMKRESGGIEGIETSTIPLWGAYTTDTQITVPNEVGYTNDWYEWYIMSLDATGKGAKSEVRSFHYGVITRSVDIYVQEIDSVIGVTTVPEVNMFMETLSGASVNIYPLISNEEGWFYYNLPDGSYRFTLNKEGFEATYYDLTVSGDVTDTWTITRSAYSITGYVHNDLGDAVQGAVVTASYPSSTFTAQTTSLGDGSFTLYMGSTNGNVTVSGSKAGHQPGEITDSIPAVTPPYTHVLADAVVLTRNSNVLNGTVTNELAQGIAGVLVTITESGNTSNSYSAYTEPSGAYDVTLPDGTWIINVSKAGFVPPPASSVTFAGDGPKTRDFTMQSQANQIEGDVTDGSSTPLPGALVSAEPSGGGSATQVYTDSYGHYALSVGLGSYDVNATLSGYTNATGTQVVNFGSTGGQTQTGIDFTMNSTGTPDNASLYVYVSDTAGDLAGVSVYIEGTGGGAVGYSGLAVTDPNGEATIAGMAGGTYDISLTKGGYTTINDSDTLVNNTTIIKIYSMTASVTTGTIYGNVTDGASALNNVKIEIYEEPAHTLATTVYTNASGNYTANTLPAPANYSVVASLSGYSSQPSQIYVALASGGNEAADFLLEAPAPGGSITITSPDPIFNDIYGPYIFAASYKDGNGKTISADFSWSVEPPSAGNIVSTGQLTPTADYMGPVSVLAYAQGLTGTVSTSIWQKLLKTYPASSKTVQDYDGFYLAIPAGAASATNSLDKITMYKSNVSGGRGAINGLKVVSKVYELTDGFDFDSNVTLTLPLPDGYNTDTATLAKWNTTTVQWNVLPGVSKTDTSVSAGINSFSEYAVVTQLQSIGVDYMAASPNPFSPLFGPTGISYSLNSTAGSGVRVTLKIYTVTGKLVATVVENEIRSIGEVHTEYWDGKNKSGNLAANGRYIVALQVEDPGGKSQMLLPIALIK